MRFPGVITELQLSRDGTRAAMVIEGQVILAAVEQTAGGGYALTYPRRLGSKVLMGYSMGAFESLFIAGTEPTNQASLIHFDRYVAINSPVRLLYGLSKLDEYFQAPLAWPASQRTDDIENTFLKVAALTKNSLTPQTSLPFSEIESKFLIGVAFKLILRDATLSNETRHNHGVLQRPIL